MGLIKREKIFSQKSFIIRYGGSTKLGDCNTNWTTSLRKSQQF